MGWARSRRRPPRRRRQGRPVGWRARRSSSRARYRAVCGSSCGLRVGAQRVEEAIGDRGLAGVADDVLAVSGRLDLLAHGHRRLATADANRLSIPHGELIADAEIGALLLEREGADLRRRDDKQKVLRQSAGALLPNELDR